MKSHNSLEKKIISFLLESSPHSKREIKAGVDPDGNISPKELNASLTRLWQLGTLAGWENKLKPSFPPPLIGAAQLLFEDCWNKAREIAPEAAEDELKEIWGEQSPFLKFARKIKIRISAEKT